MNKHATQYSDVLQQCVFGDLDFCGTEEQAKSEYMHNTYIVEYIH